jgi:hypothetical protein
VTSDRKSQVKERKHVVVAAARRNTTSDGEGEAGAFPDRQRAWFSSVAA